MRGVENVLARSTSPAIRRDSAQITPEYRVGAGDQVSGRTCAICKACVASAGRSRRRRVDPSIFLDQPFPVRFDHPVQVGSDQFLVHGCRQTRLLDVAESAMRRSRPTSAVGQVVRMPTARSSGAPSTRGRMSSSRSSTSRSVSHSVGRSSSNRTSRSARSGRPTRTPSMNQARSWREGVTVPHSVVVVIVDLGSSDDCRHAHRSPDRRH
jgi:hypothetical protein